MNNLENWKLVSKGFYRYVIGANVCYEIHIIKEYSHQNIIDAIGNLYVVGDWHDSTMAVSYFSRDLLAENKTVKELLSIAKKDFEENMLP